MSANSMDLDASAEQVQSQQPQQQTPHHEEILNFSVPPVETVEPLPSSGDGKMTSWATDAQAISSALALPSDTVTTMQTVDANGNVALVKTKQLTVSQAYLQHVQLHGRRILDSEAHDARLFTALSISQSLGGNPEIAETLQKITTKEELDAYFAKLNNEAEPITHMLDEQEKRAEASGQPLRDPMQDPAVLEMIRSTVEELEKMNMIEDAPDVKLKENTVEERVAKIRQLQETGVEVILSNPSKELLEALQVDDDNSRYRQIAEKADQAQAAVDSGLRTTTTMNPADPQQAQSLAEQVEAAAILKKQKFEGANPITRCDRTSSSAAKQSDKMYNHSAKDFANAMEKLGFMCRRLDTVAPVAPSAADEMIADMMEGCFRTEFYASRMEVLVHPAKLYLLLTGSTQPKMMNFSDVRLFYMSLFKSLSTTNMRPQERNLRKSMKEKSEKLNMNLAEKGLSAVVSEEMVADEHLEVHSKERILALQQTVYGEASMAFMKYFAEQIALVENGDVAQTKTCLQNIYQAQRVFCIETLNSYEIALMLYYEESIPVAARADLLTPMEEACEHCTAKESKSNVVARREWISRFRRTTFLINEENIHKRMHVNKLALPENPHERVDLARTWSPSYTEMWEFVRFVALHIDTKLIDDTQEKAQRWVVKYLKDMKTSNDFVSKMQNSK